MISNVARRGGVCGIGKGFSLSFSFRGRILERNADRGDRTEKKHKLQTRSPESQASPAPPTGSAPDGEAF